MTRYCADAGPAGSRTQANALGVVSVVALPRSSTRGLPASASTWRGAGGLRTGPNSTVTDTERSGMQPGTTTSSSVAEPSTTVPRMLPKSTAWSSGTGLKLRPVIRTMPPAVTGSGVMARISGWWTARTSNTAGPSIDPASLASTRYTPASGPSLRRVAAMPDESVSDVAGSRLAPLPCTTRQLTLALAMGSPSFFL